MTQSVSDAVALAKAQQDYRKARRERAGFIGGSLNIVTGLIFGPLIIFFGACTGPFAFLLIPLGIGITFSGFNMNAAGRRHWKDAKKIRDAGEAAERSYAKAQAAVAVAPGAPLPQQRRSSLPTVLVVVAGLGLCVAFPPLIPVILIGAVAVLWLRAK